MLPAPHVIMDTTLRDGEQSPHVRFTSDEKSRYVETAEEIGLRYIEVGFPLNKYDRAACDAACKASKVSRLVGMGITNSESVHACRDVGVHEIVFVVPSSNSHLNSITGKPIEQILDDLLFAADRAVEVGLIPTIGFEDASQGDTNVLKKILNTVSNSNIRFGCFRIGDTRGQLSPSECINLVDFFHQQRTDPDCRIAFHAHNDLGCATANAFSVLSSSNPADCVHATTLGLGERAGNASLEQLAVLIDTKTQHKINFDWKSLNKLTNLVSELALFPVSPFQPIVGDRVFSHEAGLHQKGVLEDASNYEILSAETFGRKTDLVFGKHSGKACKHFISETYDIDIQIVEKLADFLATAPKKENTQQLFEIQKKLRSLQNLGVSAFNKKEILNLIKQTENQKKY